MKILLLLLFSSASAFAQNIAPEEFGYRHLQTSYKSEPVEILILSKKGEEHVKKPLFLFVQGSLPTPLIILDKAGTPYRVFVFNTDSLLVKYHLAIIGKPGVPVVANVNQVDNRFVYSDPVTKAIPRKYQDNNYVDYLANRDKQAIKYLLKQNFISKERVVVAGHSEGGAVAAKLAAISPDVGKLIYASENPLGRIMIELEDARADDPTGKEAEALFTEWQNIVNNPDDTSQQKGDTKKGSYQASLPPIENLKKLTIPVLVTYGIKDHSGKYNDYLRVEMIREHKTNFTFKCYAGLDHNYFGFKPDGSLNQDVFNWDKVALDWYDWLNGKTELRALQ